MEGYFKGEETIQMRLEMTPDARQFWQDLQDITSYKAKPNSRNGGDASLPDELNAFYAHFERENITTAVKIPVAPEDPVISVSEANVRLSLKRLRVNPCKAEAPDGVPGKPLKTFANQLAGILKNIINLSLLWTEVPTCIKKTTIIPVPKKNNMSCLNDYHLVALTLTVMKCFERLVMTRLNSCLSKDLDPLQFAYRHHRSMADAISTALHIALDHLDNTNAYVRTLFIDYSSAFNTIIPTILIKKLQNLGLCTSLSNWILDFLIGRPQSVQIMYCFETLLLS
ncbi:uncharacterized protein [Hemitrygon akajei]|uniref:uncharacterized protein n=1 Tax=Hemitrygon akajei TaxID=2704970 RepID=UPI003BF9A0FE